jgi:hypothetical protein
MRCLSASLKLQNVNAQEHAVFTELKRIQQKFAKIKAAEAPQEERKTTVNQEAAARILKADLVCTNLTVFFLLLSNLYTDTQTGQQ